MARNHKRLFVREITDPAAPDSAGKIDTATTDGRVWQLVRESRLKHRPADGTQSALPATTLSELIIWVTEKLEEEKNNKRLSSKASSVASEEDANLADVPDAGENEDHNIVDDIPIRSDIFSPLDSKIHAEMHAAGAPTLPDPNGTGTPAPTSPTFTLEQVMQLVQQMNGNAGGNGSGAGNTSTGNADDKKYNFLLKKQPPYNTATESFAEWKGRFESWKQLASQSRLYDEQLAAFTLVSTISGNKTLKERLEALPLHERSHTTTVVDFVEKYLFPFTEAKIFYYLRLLIAFPENATGSIDERLNTLDKYWAELRAWALPSQFIGFMYLASAGLSEDNEKTRIDRLATETTGTSSGFEAVNVRAHLERMMKQTTGAATRATAETPNKELALYGARPASSWNSINNQSKDGGKGKGKRNKGKGGKQGANSPNSKGKTGSGDTGKWCEYHKSTSHNTNECRMLGSDPTAMQRLIQSQTDKKVAALMAKKTTTIQPASTDLIPSFLGGAPTSVSDIQPSSSSPQFSGFFTLMVQCDAFLTAMKTHVFGVFDPGCGACVLGTAALEKYTAALAKFNVEPKVIDCQPAAFSGIGGIQPVAKQGVHLPACIVPGHTFSFFAYIIPCSQTPLLLSRPLLFNDLKSTIPKNDGETAYWTASTIGVDVLPLELRGSSFVLDLLAGMQPATAHKSS
eukprot:g18376.t1